MTKRIESLNRYERARIVHWYDRVDRLARTSAVGQYLQSDGAVDQGPLPKLEDALYWLGLMRHHVCSVAHLEQDAGRERASLARRLEQAELVDTFAATAESADRVAGLRSALDEWDGRRDWHLDQAAGAEQECMTSANSSVLIQSGSTPTEIADALAALPNGLDASAIEDLADYLQAVQAVFEFTHAEDWAEAESLAIAAAASFSPTETPAERQSYLRRLEGRAGHQGVVLGGAVSQERGRRTRGSR